MKEESKNNPKTIEREYVIPLRKKSFPVPRYRKTPKAIKTIKEYLVRHMKIYDRDTNKIKIDKHLNEYLWERGIKKHPHKIKVKAIKKNDEVKVSLVKIPEKLKYKKQREEKREKKAKEKLESTKSATQKAKESLQNKKQENTSKKDSQKNNAEVKENTIKKEKSKISESSSLPEESQTKEKPKTPTPSQTSKGEVKKEENSSIKKEKSSNSKKKRTTKKKTSKE